MIPEATRPPTGYHLVSLDKASSHSGNAQSALLPQWFCYFGMIRNSIYRCRRADRPPQMAFRGSQAIRLTCDELSTHTDCSRTSTSEADVIQTECARSRHVPCSA